MNERICIDMSACLAECPQHRSINVYTTLLTILYPYFILNNLIHLSIVLCYYPLLYFSITKRQHA